MIGDANGHTNFPLKLLINDGHVSNLRKIFASNSEINVKLSKTQITTKQFIVVVFLPLLKIGLLLANNALASLAKSVLISVKIPASAVADAGIH